jgi:uncharacterized protein
VSVLVCPVCQGSMKEITTQGVAIDACTRCRGVWLDRGELEKLSAAIDQTPRTAFQPALNAAEPRYSDDRRYKRDDDDDDDRKRRSRDAYGRPQKTKTQRFMDFFD